MPPALPGRILTTTALSLVLLAGMPSLATGGASPATGARPPQSVVRALTRPRAFDLNHPRLVLPKTESAGIAKGVLIFSLKPDRASLKGETPLLSKSGEFTVSLVRGIPVVRAGKTEVTGKVRVDAGRWTHLAVQSDGRLLKLFVDGRFIASKRLTAALKTGNSRLVLGEASRGGPSYTGQMKDLQVYRGNLLTERIDSLTRATEPCSNRVQDRGEKGIDCGGTCPRRCPTKEVGDRCRRSSECKSGICAGRQCTLCFDSDIVVPESEAGDPEVGGVIVHGGAIGAEWASLQDISRERTAGAIFDECLDPKTVRDFGCDAKSGRIWSVAHTCPGHRNADPSDDMFCYGHHGRGDEGQAARCQLPPPPPPPPELRAEFLEAEAFTGTEVVFACTDSDGGPDPLTGGEAIATDGEGVVHGKEQDHCLDDNSLRILEATCDRSGVPLLTEMSCPGGTYCVEVDGPAYCTATPPATCTDTDNGSFPSVAGHAVHTDVLGRTGWARDDCYENHPDQIFEAICNESDYAQSQLTDCPPDTYCVEDAECVPGGGCDDACLRPPSGSCSDSDDGQFPTIAGEAHSTDALGGVTTEPDTCFRTDKIFEAYCFESAVAQVRLMDCPSGTVCREGADGWAACVARPTSHCDDTDHGRYPTIAGEAHSEEVTDGTYTGVEQTTRDECPSEGAFAIDEAICSGPGASRIRTDCPEGTRCFTNESGLGACLPPPSTGDCSDTDGGAVPTTAGEAVSDGDREEDTCSTQFDIVEAICTDWGPEPRSMGCPEGTRCEEDVDGTWDACLPVDPTCVVTIDDTRPEYPDGRNPLLGGEVHAVDYRGDHSLHDSCTGGERQVYDYECNPDGTYEQVLLNCPTGMWCPLDTDHCVRCTCELRGGFVWGFYDGRCDQHRSSTCRDAKFLRRLNCNSATGEIGMEEVSCGARAHCEAGACL